MNEFISDFTVRENTLMMHNYSFLDQKMIEQYKMTNEQIQRMFPGQVLDMRVNPGQQIEQLRLGINDAMRKVHRILSARNPNAATEINPRARFVDKIRILEGENFYYRINVSEEVRPSYICKSFPRLLIKSITRAQT
jgi:hypothetical protein